MKKTTHTPQSGEFVAGSQTEYALWASLKDREICPMNKPKGSGWLRRTELEQLWKLRQGQTLNRIRELLRTGVLESFNGTDIGLTGFVRPCTWYRIKKGVK